ncbi:hypothetical protein BC835DRAFT_1410854 [Cytidiella melzeri]|nr:hypothetical protein BC835DRAFT_1410854 [Cytidiella melzeri]
MRLVDLFEQLAVPDAHCCVTPRDVEVLQNALCLLWQSLSKFMRSTRDTKDNLVLFLNANGWWVAEWSPTLVPAEVCDVEMGNPPAPPVAASTPIIHPPYSCPSTLSALPPLSLQAVSSTDSSTVMASQSGNDNANKDSPVVSRPQKHCRENTTKSSNPGTAGLSQAALSAHRQAILAEVGEYPLSGQKEWKRFPTMWDQLVSVTDGKCCGFCKLKGVANAASHVVDALPVAASTSEAPQSCEHEDTGIEDTTAGVAGASLSKKAPVATASPSPAASNSPCQLPVAGSSLQGKGKGCALPSTSPAFSPHGLKPINVDVLPNVPEPLFAAPQPITNLFPHPTVNYHENVLILEHCLGYLEAKLGESVAHLEMNRACIAVHKTIIEQLKLNISVAREELQQACIAKK